MSQQYPQRLAALQSASVLLALNLLAICLPVIAKAQEQLNQGPAVVQTSGFLAGDSVGQPSQVQPATTTPPLPESSPKVSAFIAETLEPEVKMEINLHRSKLIRTRLPVTRFSITEPRVLDVVQYSPSEFELIGIEPGQTTLTLWFGGEQALRYLVRVVPSTFPSERAAAEYRILQKKINEMFPNSSVQLIPFADKLIVRGQARDSAEATQILAVLSGEGNINNLVGLPNDPNNINYRRRGPGALLNLGEAATANPGSQQDIPAHHVINLLDVPGEQQVLLKVRIAELNRTAMREMTAKLRINSGILALNTESGGISAAFSSVLNPQDLRLALTAVSTTGNTKILAEPNLVTLNGQPASFLAGGEFPVPTAVGVGGLSGFNTQFHSYGTQLTFTPTIIDKDRIRLSVAPSFSSVNKENSVQGIPGTNNRTVTTTVDLRTGQWLAIAGLLQDEQQGSKTKVPFVGDIPVVGALFSQTKVSRQETELIVLVSPELVHPIDAREMPMVLPGMELGEPNDASLFLGGAMVAKYENDRQGATASPCPSQPQGAEANANRGVMREAMARPNYQRSEKYYVYGQHGTSQ